MIVGSVAAETTAEGQLYERHSKLVYRHCLRMLGSREEAEDAAQTTFVQALRALRRGVVPAFEQAWLLKIASNECKSRHRARWRRSQRELTRDPQSLEELAEAPNGGDGRLMGVRQALARLPEMQRRALLLREWQGCSYAEVAQELGVSRPAVEALIFRARRSLARELGEGARERRHAFDLASLLPVLKSALGGGAAMKVAAGVAAVATVGVVAGGSPKERAPAVRAQNVAAVEPAAAAPPQSPGLEERTSGTGRATRREPQPASKAVPATRRKPVARRAKPTAAASAPVPAVPEAPRAEEAAPAPAAPPVDAAAPTAPPRTGPPAAAPAVPTVPEVAPLPPPPAPLPKVEVPQVPVPAVPLPPPPPLPLPQVPAVPPLPEVPDLPVVGDVPVLP